MKRLTYLFEASSPDAADQDWDIIVGDDHRGETPVKYRRIDGMACAVFKCGDVYRAQTCVSLGVAPGELT